MAWSSFAKARLLTLAYSVCHCHLSFFRGGSFPQYCVIRWFRTTHLSWPLLKFFSRNMCYCMGDQICSQLLRKGERKHSPVVSFSLYWGSSCWWKLLVFPHPTSTLSTWAHYTSYVKDLHRSNCLIVLHHFLDSCSLLRVGGHIHKAKIDFPSCHPVVIHGQHPNSKLFIQNMWDYYMLAQLSSLVCLIIDFTLLVVTDRFAL